MTQPDRGYRGIHCGLKPGFSGPVRSKKAVIEERLERGETTRQIADATGIPAKLVSLYGSHWRKERGLNRKINRVHGPLPECFEAKVDRSGGPDACHIWTAGTMAEGYGCFQDRKGELGPPQQHRAHRVAWILAHGWIGPETLLLHTCDNPRCVNVRHLRPGTQYDNMQDAIDKGRHVSVFARGKKRGSVTLPDGVFNRAERRRREVA